MSSNPAALPEPVESNPRAISIYTIVVVALAILGVLTVVGGIVLAWGDKALPESVIVLGSVAVGALAGMVAPQSLIPLRAAPAPHGFLSWRRGRGPGRLMAARPEEIPWIQLPDWQSTINVNYPTTK